MEQTPLQENAGVVVLGGLGVAVFGIVGLVLWLNAREKRRQREALVAAIAEAPLLGSLFDPGIASLYGAAVGALFAVVMITVRQRWAEPKQLVGLVLFALIFGLMGRALSLVPVRRGTLRLDKAAGTLVAEARMETGSVDLKRPFKLARFFVMPGLPYPSGMTAVVLEQGAVAIRFAWPLTILDPKESKVFDSANGPWWTDRRGKAICEYLEGLSQEEGAHPGIDVACPTSIR